jgi:hypothetical protein
MRIRRHPTTLDRVLREQGRSARWLAGQIGAHEAEVSRWRHGLHVPEQRTRDAIARALGKTVDEFDWSEQNRAAA